MCGLSIVLITVFTYCVHVVHYTSPTHVVSVAGVMKVIGDKQNCRASSRRT
jgi:hypothetical protein